MVYRGRPSTGCRKCRQRKIKCDERPEGCVKCADKGFQCPGYEHTIDRLFQDESAAVERKAQKSKARALAARDERNNAEKARRAIKRMQHDIGGPLLFPVIDRGIAFFMMHYAAGVDLPPLSSAAYNKHLSTNGFHPIVATVMTALGLAGTANLFMDSGLKREATTWYLDALKMTNKALEKPSEAKSDNTLLATMLLSVFESTHNEVSFKGWLEHVSGSSSLVRMRGRAQFETPAGRRMYFQTVGLLTIKCMGMGIALPKFVHDLNKEVEKWEDPHDPVQRFFHIHIATIDFRAHIINHRLTDMTAIVQRALEIDEEAKRMFEAAGQDWEYVVETCEEGTPGIFGQEYHIYPHLAAAQTWNWIRYIRIYLHDILRNSLIAGFSATPPVFPASCTTEFRSPAMPTDQLPVIRVSGGYSSLWALYIAGATPIASPEAQAFVLRSLERVATEFGINQARVIASALRTKMELEARGLTSDRHKRVTGNAKTLLKRTLYTIVQNAHK
ncbi:hypothetical protein BU23DRAFT_586724 [Bimuria novae-zelandiae CBS 107.79]|uniref:Zn(2)-C6 fungal-type domain-containing protein n=1 Tax=Bimuria novae-zelandiae CBS 107.79 TaxID=1447943 RepID=A0A6A5VT57_9PLEO|nr:hypothetical protein BU23DRAFT_586724 [Bimuria novae-zelandiae CBS 107.79]